MKSKTKTAQKSKTSAKETSIDVLIKGIEDAQKEILNEVKSPTLTVEQILNLPTVEQQTKAFKTLESSNRIEVESKVKAQRESKIFLRGVEQLGLFIYNASVNGKTVTTVNLYNEAKRIKNSLGIVIGMKVASFKRTFNTSLAKLYKNRTSNEMRKEKEKREIEQVLYFDNVNQTLKEGLKNERFTEMFSQFDKAELSKGVEVYTNTLISENTTFGNYNILLVKPQSLKLFRTWLKFKGAKPESFTDFLEITK